MLPRTGTEHQVVASKIRRHRSALFEELKANTLIECLECEARDLVDEMLDQDINSYVKIIDYYDLILGPNIFLV